MDKLKEMIIALFKDFLLKTEKAFKEFSRVALLGVISYFITDGVEILVNMLGVQFSLDQGTKFIISGALTSALKAIDRQIHDNESKKPAEDQKTGWLGLTGLTGF